MPTRVHSCSTSLSWWLDRKTVVPAALSAAFASEDYDVVIAKNGHEAIERMRERRFDIALLDLNTVKPLHG